MSRSFAAIRFNAKEFVTFAMMLTLAAPAQAQLPSQSFDDYDLDKYQQLVQKERRDIRPLQDEYKDAVEKNQQNQKQVQQLQKAIAELEKEIQKLENQIGQNKTAQDQFQQRQADLPGAIQRLKTDLQDKRARLQEVQAEIRQLEQQAGPAQGEVTQLQQEISQLEGQIGQIEQQISGLNTQLAQEQQKLTRIEDQIEKIKARGDGDNDGGGRGGDRGGDRGGGRGGDRGEDRPERPDRPDRPERGDREARLARLESEKIETQNEINQLNSKIADLNQKQTQVSSRLNNKKADLARLEGQNGGTQGRLAQLKTKETQLSNQVQNLEKQLRDAETQQSEDGAGLQRLQTQEAQLKSALDQKQRELAAQTQALAKEQQQLANTTAKVAALKTRLDQQKAELDKAEARLEVVKNNLEKAREMLSRMGFRHGSDDGDRSGNREGTDLGAAAGQEQGYEDGRNDGLEESIRQAQAAGQAEGQRIGNQTGHRDGERQGEVDGARDGKNEGTADGLKQAYDDGYKSGYADGFSSGRDRGAYLAGQQRGRAQGLVDAIQEALPLERKAYLEVESTYLNAPLKKISLGDDLVSKDFDGLQERKKKGRRGDRKGPRNNRGGHGHREGGLPHPRLKDFYQNAYDRAFDDAFRSAYERGYDLAFERSYNQAYDRTYDQFETTQQPEYYKQSYDSAYRSAYNSAYRRRYDEVYAQEKKIAYAEAFAIHRQNAAQIAQGQADGLRIGSQDKGYKDGRAEAYKENIEIEKQKSVDRGSKAAHDLYMNNAVLKFVSADWMDQDGDGFFRPGESIDLMIRVKNFGLKSSTQVNEKISGVQNLAVSSLEQNSGEIQAQSETTILRRARIAIDQKVVDGTAIGLTLTHAEGEKTLGQKKFATKALYSIGLKVEGSGGKFAPGATRNLVITLKNRSATAQKVVMNLDTDTEVVKAGISAETTLDLKANEERKVTTTLKALESGFLLTTPVDVSVIKGGKVWAQTHRDSLSVVQKYAKKADSRSLVISSGKNPKSTARLYQSGKTDVWDFRVDSTSVGSGTIGKYSGKIVQLMADSALNITDDAVSALKSHFKNAGSIIIWGSDLRGSQDVEALLKSMNILVGETRTIEGKIQGLGAFNDIAPTVSGQFTSLEGQSVLTNSLMKSEGANLMMMTLTGATKSQYGRIFVVGANPDVLGAAAVKQIVDRVESLQMGWDKKLNAARSKASNLRFVMSDIRDEVALAEADSSWLYFKEFGRNNRIQRLIEQVLFKSETSAEVKAAVVGYYPYVHGLVAGLSKEKPYAEKVLLIKPSTSSKSWKQQYCSKNAEASLCK